MGVAGSCSFYWFYDFIVKYIYIIVFMEFYLFVLWMEISLFRFLGGKVMGWRWSVGGGVGGWRVLVGRWD